MNEPKSYFEHIKNTDSLKEIPLEKIKSYESEPIYILCQDSLLNCPFSIDIKQIINKTISNNEINLISQNPLKLNFTFNEIITLNKNNKEFYIVNY